MDSIGLCPRKVDGMAKISRQTDAMKRTVRKIQRWLAKHEYMSSFGFKLHRCNLRDGYGRPIAICRTGVVVSAGGGCVIEHWTEYTTSQLKQLTLAACLG